MKRVIYMFMAVIGFIVCAGTIGAGDTESIGLTQLVIQCLIGSGLVAIGCFGLNLEERREANRWHKKNNLSRK